MWPMTNGQEDKAYTLTTTVTLVTRVHASGVTAALRESCFSCRRRREFRKGMFVLAPAHQGKTWRELEAAAHTVSAAGKQREMDAGAKLDFYPAQHPSGMLPPSSMEESFLLSSTFLDRPSRHTQRCGFHGDSKSTQASMRVNPHPHQLHTLAMLPCRDAWGNSWPWYPRKLLI